MILPYESGRKRLAVLAGGAAAAWMFYALLLSPVLERGESLDRLLEKSRRDLAETASLADKYIRLSSSLPAGGGEGAALPATAVVEQAAKNLGMAKNVQRMAPKTDPSGKKIEELSVVISGCPYATFTDMLQKLFESPAGISVRHAKIRSGYENPGVLDVEMSLAQ